MIIKRKLLMSLPMGQSAFLWGARKTGKSTYLRQYFPMSVYYDLLNSELETKLLTHPHLLREEIVTLPQEKLTTPIIIDEIQKVPALLNEVHWLIENKRIGFVLCGSSARKLKHGAANLLGGRAWRFEFFPLIYQEIPNFDLKRALNHGLIPSHYLMDSPKRSLRAYVIDYLKEEIQAEGLVRDLPAFARFLDVVGFSHGELLNFSNIARDCHVHARTVKEYYQILVDTLIGYFVEPYIKKMKRHLIMSTPKFYLFDVGIANYLQGITIQQLKGIEAGRAFEHFIFMEIRAFLGLNELDISIQYWRTKIGLEVDFILGDGNVAIEAKISDHIDKSDIKGLIAYCEENQPAHALVVCNAPKKRLMELSGVTISVFPWCEFIDALWNRKFL